MLTRALRSRAALPLGYLALAVLLLLPAWRHPATSVPGFDGDSDLFRWFLRWAPWALAHGHNPLQTTYVHAPAGGNLMWNTWVPLAALLVWPVTALFGTAVSYTVLLTLGLALAGWAAACAARRFTADPVAVFVAGLAYGASPYLLAQALGHLHLVLAAWFPPVVLCLVWDALAGRRPPGRSGVLLGLAVTAATLTSEEVVLTTALLAVAGLLVAALLWRPLPRPALAALARLVAVTGLVALVLLALPLGWQLFGPRRVTGVIQPPDYYVADLSAYAVPSQLLAVAPRAVGHTTDRYTGNRLENGAFLGPLFVVGLYVLVRYRRDRRVVWAGVVGVVAALLSLGPRLHLFGGTSAIPLPWALLDGLPLAPHVLPVRLTAYVFLALAMLLAVFVGRARASPVTSHRRGGLAVAALALLAFAPRLPYPTRHTAVPGFFTGIGVRTLPAGALVVVAPPPHDTGASAAMVWQEASGFRFRMPYGYFIAPSASPYGPFALPPSAVTTLVLDSARGDPVDPALGPAVRDQLAAWRAAAFVVGPMDGRAALVSALTGILGSPPEEVGGVSLWRLPTPP